LSSDGRELLDDVSRVAADVGPALAPVGHEELLSSIILAARRLFRATACSLALLDEDRQELVFHLASGGVETIVGMRLPVGRGIAGWVLASGQAIAVEDVSQDERFAEGVAETLGYVPRSILAVPLETDREVLGVIEILDWEGDLAGRGEDMELLQLFARQAALAIETSRVFGDLGRVLFTAAARAVGSGDLSTALKEVAESSAPPSSDLAALAALFGELARYGADERRVATRLVEDFLEYLRRPMP
jgi:GAF domain-containing protein